MSVNQIQINKLLCLGILFFMIGCSPSPEKLIEQRRAAVNLKLDDIAAIGRKVNENIPLKQENITINREPISFGPSSEKTNAVVVGPEHFENSKLDVADFSISMDQPFEDVHSLLKSGKLANGKPPYDSEVVGRVFDTIMDLRYILVVRIGQFNPPSVQGASFSSGWCTGEVQLYEIKNRLLLGGFRFKAQNSDKIELPKEGANLHLVGDLRKNVIKVIRSEFKKRYPDGNPPLAGG